MSQTVLCVCGERLHREIRVITENIPEAKLMFNVKSLPATGNILMLGTPPGWSQFPASRPCMANDRLIMRIPLLSAPGTKMDRAARQQFDFAVAVARRVLDGENLADMQGPFSFKMITALAAVNVIGGHAPTDKVSVDIETTSIDPRQGKIVSVAFQWWDEDVTYAVYGIENATRTFKALAAHCVAVSAVNSQFEGSWCLVHCGVPLHTVNDPQVSSALVDEAGLKSLDILSFLVGCAGYDTNMNDFLRPMIVKAGKPVRAKEPGSTRMLTRKHHDAPQDLLCSYNARDVYVDVLLSRDYFPSVLAMEPGRPFEVEMWLNRAQNMLAQVRHNGMVLDRAGVLATTKRYASLEQEAECTLLATAAEAGMEKYSPATSANNAVLAYDYLGYPVLCLTNGRWTHPSRYKKNWWAGRGQPSCGGDAIALLRSMPEHKDDDFLVALEQYSMYAAMNSQVVLRCKDAVLDGDGRVHSDFSVTKLLTGQVSSTNPPVQNIPGGEFRRNFVSRFGHDGMIGEFDHSQLHLRIIGNLAKCPGFIDAFADGVDLHSKTAALVIMKIAVEDFIKRHAAGNLVCEAARDRGKRTNFSIIFEIGANALGLKTHTDPNQVQHEIDEWFAIYPEIREQIERQHAFAAKHGYVISPFGRVRHIPEARSRERGVQLRAFRQAGDYLVSNAGRYITLYGMVMAHERMMRQRMKSQIICQVHDSVEIDIHKSEVDDVIEIVHDEMLVAMAKMTAGWMDPIPLQIDGFMGPNWYKKDATHKVVMTEGSVSVKPVKAA